MQAVKVQNGAVLLLILMVVLLGSSGWLLSNLQAQKTAFHIEDQYQTIYALTQAKEALIGFAAIYGSGDASQQPGYLPCPDANGDGEADSCGAVGHTVMGLLPWRTLGLPPLRDGNGECLWYVVSGTYKDDERQIITSDTNGLLIVQKAEGDILAGDAPINRAIAIVLAPGEAIAGNHNRTPKTGTECGIESVQTVAQQYLDSYGNIDNASGTGMLVDNPTLATNLLVTNNANDISTFLKTSKIRDASGLIETFNDTLILITPQDFEHVYNAMTFWVAQQVTNCLLNYNQMSSLGFQDYYINVLGNQQTPAADTYREVYTTEIEEYVSTLFKQCTTYCAQQEGSCKLLCANKNCKTDCTNEKIVCDNDCEANKVNDRREAIATTPKYPRPVDLVNSTDPNTSYTNDPMDNTSFGRIPDSFPLSSTPCNSFFCAKSTALSNWTGNCFQWNWWPAWKDTVFVTMRDENIVLSHNNNGSINFWIDRARETSYPSKKVTKWESLDIFNEEKHSRKESTLARVTSPENPWFSSEWDYVTPIPVSVSNLRLDDNGEERIPDFLVLVAGRRLAGQSRQSPGDRTDVSNYLEGENASTVDEFFERKIITTDFNDIICDKDGCEIPAHPPPP